MRRFSELYRKLDETTKTGEKLAALREYLATAPPEDAAWAVHFLSGGRIKRLVKSGLLGAWCIEVAGIPDWLFGECIETVGDFAETMALLLPRTEESSPRPLHAWVEEVLLPMLQQDVSEQERTVKDSWQSLDVHERFVWNKIVTGEFRIGVSKRLVTRALAEVAGLNVNVIAHRMMGSWTPSADFYISLLAPEGGDTDASRPYPFFLAHPLEGGVEQLGNVGEWQAEWKWDGIRAQLIRRGGHTYLWSRGEELITERFPEVEAMAWKVPEGSVLDGEVLAWSDGRVMAFSELQKRIGRKKLGQKILAEVPAVFLSYDLMEREGQDIRHEPLRVRRRMLEDLVDVVGDARLLVSPLVEATSWEELAALRTSSRERGVEGLMLKHVDSPYRTGRPRGEWWKWKIDPLTVDGVLIYAQRGHGRRASLYTDYTFGVWDDNGTLVPFAKAYSGLTDDEIRQVDAFVRRNTLEKFGPVRHVKPELVFEIGFEGIRRSTRHRSGVALRFPRMLRWRTDKQPADADTVAALHALVETLSG